MERIAFYRAAAALIAVCTGIAGSAAAQSYGVLPYDLTDPDQVFLLPRELREISGITALDGRLLAAIQDEEGILFVIDGESGEVVEQKKFGRRGDYEGIAAVGDSLFVIRSDGTLFRIDDWRADELKAAEVKTPLTARYDTEGLGFDRQRNRLLIACKEYPGDGLRHVRAIYSFDLARNSLQSDPAILVDVRTINRDGPDSAVNRLIRTLSEPVFDLSGFKPSDIAIHPHTDQLYILSSVRKLLLVTDLDGTILAIQPLRARLFPQPEGLAFREDGTLFISNEGAGGRATLLRFNAR